MSVARLKQDAQDVAAAREASLPPLQSVVELTSAFRPPTRGEAPVTAQAAPSSAGAFQNLRMSVLPLPVLSRAS